MTFGEIISARRRELGMNQSELASELTAEGMPVSNQAVSKWENGTTLPNARQFLTLCTILEIEDIRAAFSGGSGGIMRDLNYEGQEKALEYIQLLRDSGRYAPEHGEKSSARCLPLYSLAVSAGTGQFLDSEDYELIEADGGVPEGANFGVRVAGDSMEPEFHDGQTVWVRQQRSLMTGEIGIFLYDGNVYLKQLLAGEDRMRLHSLNSSYEDIPVSPELPLRVLGKVLR